MARPLKLGLRFVDDVNMPMLHDLETYQDLPPVYVPDKRLDRMKTAGFAAMAAGAAVTVGLGLAPWQGTPRDERSKAVKIQRADKILSEEEWILEEERSLDNSKYDQDWRTYPNPMLRPEHPHHVQLPAHYWNY